MVFKKCAWIIPFNLKVFIFIDIVDDYLITMEQEIYYPC